MSGQTNDAKTIDARSIEKQSRGQARRNEVCIMHDGWVEQNARQLSGRPPAAPPAARRLGRRGEGRGRGSDVRRGSRWWRWW